MIQGQKKAQKAAIVCVMKVWCVWHRLYLLVWLSALSQLSISGFRNCRCLPFLWKGIALEKQLILLPLEKKINAFLPPEWAVADSVSKQDFRMKTIQVSAAIIHDNVGRIFATQRGYGDMQGGWEFPGGKIEAGETPEAALKREMSEELDTQIAVERFITTVEYDYPNFHLTMQCYWCRVESGCLTLKEHKAAKWLSANELDSVNWLPADKIVLEKIKR